MALPATCVHEVQTGGSDTANGGHFDPSNANMATDLAATSATGNSPVVTSASYTFVAGDVGSWIFIKSGTNWTPGWYKIASVAAGAATLQAAVGQALSPSYVANTVAGCAIVASPTVGTWAVDYSQVTGAIALTGLTSSAANAIILTVSATVAMVGNGIIVKSGTNAITGIYNISSVSAGVSLTVDRNWGTAAVAAGTAGVGGCFASPGQVGAVIVNSNLVWMKTGTYSIANGTVNTAGNKVSVSATSTQWIGYGTLRNDGANRAVWQASVASVVALTMAGNRGYVAYMDFDGNAKSTTTGLLISIQNIWVHQCIFRNTTDKGLNWNGQGGLCTSCRFTGNSSWSLFGSSSASGATFYMCEADANTSTPFYAGAPCNYDRCIAKSSNASSGWRIDDRCTITNCTSYGNGSDGFFINSSGYLAVLINCLATGNGGYGYNGPSSGFGILVNCAGYNNTSGNYVAANFLSVVNFVTLTADPFTNAAGGDFSLNNTAGGGAACRAAGIPGAFLGISTTGYLDIGAVQHTDPTKNVIGSPIVRPMAGVC